MPLDPTVANLLQQMADAGAPPISDLSPEEGRAMYRLMQAEATREPLEEVRDLDAKGVPLRLYRPSSEPGLPVLVFFHGGGWVIGDLETHDAPCRLLARRAHCVVIAVDYRLAPEHPFPASLDDCYNAASWVAANAEDLELDPARIAVGGDSAGGNLATVVCLRARKESGPKFVHQLLVYPVTDCSMDTPSYSENADGYMLTANTMAWFWDHYADKSARLTAQASPLREASLTGLPPATILTAEFDPLRDEGEAYAARLKAAGVPTVLKRYDGLIHGFVSMTDVIPLADEAVSFCALQLKNAFDD